MKEGEVGASRGGLQAVDHASVQETKKTGACSCFADVGKRPPKASAREKGRGEAKTGGEGTRKRGGGGGGEGGEGEEGAGGEGGEGGEDQQPQPCC